MRAPRRVQVPLFKACTSNVIALLVQRLTMVMYMPDEVIIKEGANGDSMFFIQGGAVYIVQKQTILGELKQGNFFGEVALTSARGARRTASVLSRTVATLQQLSRQDLEEVALDEPGVLVLIRQTAIKRRRELGEDIRALKDTAFSVLIRNRSSANLVDSFRKRNAAMRAAKKVHPEASGHHALRRRSSLKAAVGASMLSTKLSKSSRRKRLAAMLARVSSRVRGISRLGGRSNKQQADPCTALSGFAQRARVGHDVDVTSGLPLAADDSMRQNATFAVHPTESQTATESPGARPARAKADCVSRIRCTQESVTSGSNGDWTPMDELMQLVRTLSKDVQSISDRQGRMEKAMEDGLGETRARMAAALRSTAKPRRY